MSIRVYGKSIVVMCVNASSKSIKLFLSLFPGYSSPAPSCSFVFTSHSSSVMVSIFVISIAASLVTGYIIFPHCQMILNLSHKFFSCCSPIHGLFHFLMFHHCYSILITILCLTMKVFKYVFVSFNCCSPLAKYHKKLFCSFYTLTYTHTPRHTKNYP